MQVEQGSLKSGNISVKVTDTLGTPVNPATSDNQTNGSQVTQITGTVPLPTGAATSANQALELTQLQNLNMIDFATEAKQDTIIANQTNKSQVTQLADSSGNIIGSFVDVSGVRHLAVTAVQAVTVIASNSSTDNINSGATFTGTSASTLGVNAIQVTLKTDVNCTVYVDQSPNGTNWDISDSYNYYYSLNNFSTTVQAVNSYFRVRVTNNSSVASTYFRLQSILTPIVEALPRSTNENGYLKTHTYGITDEYGFTCENSPNGDSRSITPVLLAGKTYEGTTIDTNFFVTTVANGGTVTQLNNEQTITTNTTANGSAKVHSLRRARYVPGCPMVLRTKVRLSNIGATNNIRKWGIVWGATMPTYTDGFIFQLNGTTFSIVTIKGNTPTTVSSGSFNGTYGATYALDLNYHTYEIYYTDNSVYFTIDGKTLHSIVNTAATISGTVQLHTYLESTNSNSAVTNNSVIACTTGIRRLGPLLNQPTYKYQAGTTAGVVCKYGLGNLHGIVISNVTNNAVITLYDNTAASAPVIWSSGAMSNQTVPLNIPLDGIPFYTGLTFDITGANCNILLKYE